MNLEKTIRSAGFSLVRQRKHRVNVAAAASRSLLMKLAITEFHESDERWLLEDCRDS